MSGSTSTKLAIEASGNSASEKKVGCFMVLSPRKDNSSSGGAQKPCGSPRANEEKGIQQPQVLTSVAAVISDSLLQSLPEETIKETLQRHNVQTYTSENKFYITGPWDGVAAVKSELEKAAESEEGKQVAHVVTNHATNNQSLNDTSLLEMEVTNETDSDQAQPTVMNERKLLLIKSQGLSQLTRQRVSKDVIKALLRLEKQNQVKSDNDFHESYVNAIPERDPNEDKSLMVNPKKGVKNKTVYKNPELAKVECGVCGYRSTKEGVARHRQRRHPKTTYECAVCKIRFGVKYDMRRHRMNHFDASGKLTAKGRRFYKQHHEGDPDQVTLADYEENFGENDQNVFTLSSDGKVEESVVDPNQPDMAVRYEDEELNVVETEVFTEEFKTSNTSTSKRYKNRYPPRETSRSKCKYCNKEFPDRVMRIHLRTHENKPLLTCSYGCGFETREKCRMNDHIRNRHIKLWKCHECDAEFHQKASLEVHLEGVHGSNVQCNICGKMLSTARYLTIHMKREHEKIKRHFCSTCQKGFYEKSDMVQHSLIHMTKEARELTKNCVCSYCPMRFTRRSVMLQHENTHTGNLPYACAQCPKKFSSSAALNKHKRAHSDVRNHECPICLKAFKFRYKRDAHMIIHTKDRKYGCDDCGKCFTSATSLKKHSCRAFPTTDRRRKYRSEKTASVTDNISGEEKPEEETVQNEMSTVFMCGFCSQMFSSSDEINAHLLEHKSDTEQEHDLADLDLCEMQAEGESQFATEVIAEQTEAGDLVEQLTGETVFQQDNGTFVIIQHQN